MPLAVGGSKSNDKAPATASSGPGGGGRTTFRPPWVKSENSDKPLLKPTVKTAAPPWSKKPVASEKENGEKASVTPATSTQKTSATTAAAPKKDVATKKDTPDAVKKIVAPTATAAAAAKKPTAPVAAAKTPPLKDTKLQSREIKVPITRDQPKVIPEPLKPKATPPPTVTKKPPIAKPPPPPTSSSTSEETSDDEEEDETSDDEDDETEEESESEEETKPPPPPPPATTAQNKKNAKPQENELQRRFAEEKPKLRPVVVKRDKSLSTVKKRNEAAGAGAGDGGDDDDDEAVEGETAEERETRLRFKLDKPKLRHVVVNKEKTKMAKSIEDFDKIRPVLKKVPKVDEILKEPKEEPKPEFKNKVLKKVPSITREPSKKNVPAPPPLPSMIPKAPPPPPPTLGPPSDFEKKQLSHKQKEVIEKLKTRPRRRPDWSEMMKEVESGRKLRHVECNDRSQPIITCKSMTKVDDKFVYETEKDNSHNKLLKQIQSGVRLKPTQTNDRSKPVLEGLRKFRRQMTIEEQIQKSQSKASLANMAKDDQMPDEIVDEISSDELDDIDKIRDDLQSTKQMLALELRNREAQDRENKRLLAKIAALEAELSREKSRETNFEYGSNTIIATNETSAASDEAFVNTLKQDAEQARKINKELEKKYQDTGEQLDIAKGEIEEQKRTILQLERKLAQALQGNITKSPNNIKPRFTFCYSYDEPSETDAFCKSSADSDGVGSNRKQMFLNIKNGGSLNGSRRPSNANANKESSPEYDLGLSESDEDEDEEKKAARKERRLGREIKMLHSKLNKLKDKQETAKKERESLKLAMKKNHVLLKEENKKFKKLEKEVQKMAASMKEDENEDDSDVEKDIEDEEVEDEEEEEESEEESESESDEETGSETESESEPENATNDAKKNNLEPRVKRHENRLLAMKKCNVLLQANVDNIQDEITKIRTKAASLQAELDSVISDLGL